MKTITQQQLRERIYDVTLISTLSKDKFNEHRIQGSINIPQQRDDFTALVYDVVSGNTGEAVVLYGANQSCDSALAAAKKLEAAGFTNVYVYQAGAEGWHSSMVAATV